MNFKTYIEMMLPPIWRKPRWLALLVSITEPLAQLYTESTGIYEKLKRRAACDGSIIALEHLIETEFNKKVKITEPNYTGRIYLKQRNEQLRGAKLHKRGQGWVYLYGRGLSSIGGYDYTVKLLEPADQETAQRIAAVTGIYNSAGFTYNVEI